MTERLHDLPAPISRFLADPHTEAARAGLPEEQWEALERIDRVGLEMAARSFARKRAPRRRPE